MSMNNHSQKLQALFGLKWNPFVAEIPVDGLYRRPVFDNFGWRIENLIIDGGFALVVGDPGHGKSACFRILEQRFRDLKDVSVANIDRPQSNLADFYRELGERFGIELSVSNRWGGYKALREKWRSHIATTLFRPVLLIDEAQQMKPYVLSELRLLSSDHFDSRRILTVVIAGDKRLTKLFETADLLPLASRVRCQLIMDPLSREEMIKMLTHVIESAGNRGLMTPGLIQTLVEHSAGVPRIMMNTADELLANAVRRELTQIDEKLFFDVMADRLPKRRPPKS